MSEKRKTIQDLIDMLKKAERDHGGEGVVKRYRVEVEFDKSTFGSKYDEQWHHEPRGLRIHWGKQ